MGDDAIVETDGTNNGGTADEFVPLDAGGADPVDAGGFEQPSLVVMKIIHLLLKPSG